MRVLKFLICCVWLFSCKEKSNNFFAKDWYLIQAGFNDNDSSGYENMALSLNEDGTYSHYAVGFYNYGKWEWSEGEQVIRLMPDSGNQLNGTFVFEVVEKKEEGEISVKRILKKGNVLVKKKRADTWYSVENKTKYNPFKPELNTWRIKPSAPESKEQIKARTILYIQFLKEYFNYIIENDLQYLTYGWYPQPFRLHFANTARMSYSTELIDWNKCFYNEEQAVEGYKLLSGSMYYLKLKHRESLAERNLDLVNQLLAVIK